VGIPSWTIPKNQTVGAFVPGAGAESALDEQYVVAMAPQASKWYWTEADWQYEFGTAVIAAADNKVPKVMSISYAWYEMDQCDISPGVAPCTGKPVPAGSQAFVAACNAMYAKIGARGISLISASGDSGAHGRTDPGCTGPITRPDYPAASPFLTAVGATELAGGKTGSNFKAPICKSTLQCANGGTEVVASNKLISFFSSGGGFSIITPMPKWQETVVKAYLASKPIYPLPASSVFNASNRGFPDVSALGHHYYVELGGQVQAVDGTSAATPVFSGLVASLNGWRAANGKPTRVSLSAPHAPPSLVASRIALTTSFLTFPSPRSPSPPRGLYRLGYLNPLLYSIYAKDPTAFNDVLTGDNSCTESACPCPANTGFGAVAGWDAATGLGTPNYEKIKAAITAMGI
jgi:tripeptidyl-peptidase-1